MRRAYRGAHYEVETATGVLELQCGCCPPPERLAALGIKHRWAVVTPCNPFSERLPDIENKRRLRQFHTELRLAGFHWYPSLNRDPGGQWPDEAGALLCDVSHARVLALAAQYGQYAVLTAALARPAHLAWTAWARSSRQNSPHWRPTPPGGKH